MNNKELIEKFYSSFARGDAEAMVSCYDNAVVFTDPAFGELHGEEAKNMWRMLIKRSGGKMHIEFSNAEAGERFGQADWRAEYVFTATGRKVINSIAAHFEFENGKILRHSDHFSLWKWSRQALGWKGFFLGWSAFMKNKIQKQTRHLLKSYGQQH